MSRRPHVLQGQEPGDGLRVRVEGLPGASHWLELIFYAGGERFAPVQGRSPAVMLKLWDEFTEKAIGERQRLRFLAEAVARFLNTGGGFQEIHDTLLAFQRFIPGGRDLDTGHYIDAVLNTDGVWEHLFAMAPASEHVVRWVEDTFIDTFPRADLDAEPEFERGPEEDTPGPLALSD